MLFIVSKIDFMLKDKQNWYLCELENYVGDMRLCSKE